MVIQEDLYREWTQPDEKVRVALAARGRTVGSRVGGVVRVPHPMPPGTPEIMWIDRKYPDPAEFTVAGQYSGHEWADDDSLGWWAEAADPTLDAARAADALAIGQGEIGLAITDRRIAVIFPEKLLASTQQARKDALKERSLVGKAMGSVGIYLDGDSQWDFRDKVYSVWETDVRRVVGWDVVLVGRSFPFPELLRVGFQDGSVLYARTQPRDLIE
ncbi:hypothetical protein JOD54_001394 [Actinokineospora baliensis]|uniref:hypothetical protein n=1 Tax=Actinokineospora baliensis TaxID=547056 RepID=UPI0019577044|nr:hypothetical protein [Actinokineospora baliensis]MBM7771190.1 hypothetical protein [Actinokineospora baliensis]